MSAESELSATVNGPRLSYGVKILYGLGDVSNAIKVVTFGLYSLFFATAVKGVPGTWVGAVGFVAMLWDAIIDPCIGYLTDGVNAGSKRFNFMLVGALTMGVGFWAFFAPPRNLSTVMLCAWLLAASFVVRTATSIYSIPYYALGMNLSRDYHERTSITGIRSFASGIGTLLTASLSFVVFFPEKVKGVDPKLDQSGYASMGLTFGLVM
ncbi:MAG TPA: MFS transporter, partial [Bryobacteraceae bacterium]